MAEKKKKKGLYSKKLKDINKDGKKNFGDTFLGDLIGADGKAGVQGPGMKSSLKGARRVSDEDKKKKSSTSKKPAAKKKSMVDTTDDARSARTNAPSTKRKSTVDTTDDARSGRTNAPSGPKVKLNGVTWEEYLDINGNNALKRLAYDLPANLTKQEFMKKARESQKTSKRTVDTTDDARARRKRVNSVPGKQGPSIPGMAKGGLVSKSRKGHTDHRKKGLFK